MSRTDETIARIRGLIRSGRFAAGARLPPTHELAVALGTSRGPLREAVKALAVAGVLDVRHGDGTYVTSLAPGLLLAGVGRAVELMRGNAILEMVEVRRLLEPLAAELAATRASEEDLAAIREHLAAMRDDSDADRLHRHDAAFHHAVASAAGNEVLRMLLYGVSSATFRTQVRDGAADDAARTLAEHTAIYEALAERDAAAARASVLLHVVATERRLKEHLRGRPVAGQD